MGKNAGISQINDASILRANCVGRMSVCVYTGFGPTDPWGEGEGLPLMPGPGQCISGWGNVISLLILTQNTYLQSFYCVA